MTANNPPYTPFGCFCTGFLGRSTTKDSQCRNYDEKLFIEGFDKAGANRSSSKLRPFIKGHESITPAC